MTRVDEGDDAPAGEKRAEAGDDAPAGEKRAAASKAVEVLIRIAGVDFLLVPATRRTGSADANGTMSRGTAAAKRRLWEARQAARLTQAQLAKRLGRSQAMVSQAESGTSRVSERYVSKVLDACGLQQDWGHVPSSETLSGWQLDPRDIAGIDPETFEPVRRGSERDIQLGLTFAWWDGFRSQS
jgi:transcriptional regulator with XRE-family HTH domain